MYQAYWGQSLSLIRRVNRLSQEEVLTELNSRSGRNISRETFDGMEFDLEDIDEALFDVWCSLFTDTKVHVLKYAQFFQENAHKSEAQILHEAKEEIEYRLWKHDQEN